MYTIKDHPNANYRLINNLMGWVAFLIASITYILTIEPTTSLWDCGEFITTSIGLQVGHPPGAPLFMILSRLFAIFAPSPDKQALMVNCMSALASGFTVLFLFWSISHLARKLVLKESKVFTPGQLIAVMGASLIGALAYTFSDTFWFSAVESEVYALSSLFTAVVFWAILKWENVAFEPYANRWLILIAYLMGLSIGVHLLNLLAIPAIVFVYYFKKYTPTKKGVLRTGIIALLILGFVNFLLIPGVLKIACWFELAFVNGMGLPFNTGVIIYALLVIAGLAFGIRYSLQKNKPVLNTIFTCLVVILIGYSSYAMVVIRSTNNPPIDENSPDNVFALLSYINRDQYGDSPLIYGHYYNAPVIDIKEGSPLYYQDKKKGKYELVQYQQKLIYDKRFCTVFPRMYSNQRPSYPQDYEAWGGKASGPVYSVNGETVRVPSFGNNLRYFFSYQLGHMYWRYFMWNFAGRQNDMQGFGDILHGNWLTGIKFLDEIRLGNLSELTDIQKGEKALNKYYLLPLILGLMGMFYQYRKGRNGKMDFWIVMMLFILTGIAVIVYLNQGPKEPRERDYAYAGSFYAFSVWIGLGTLMLWEWLQKILKSPAAAATATALCFAAVPLNMAAQNWDDHDRAGRDATIAHAKNYLNSCAPNAILFTYGDNDTFPLWYAQEAEGIRRDVRVVNLSLLAGGWYIDQMNRKAYESDRVPISLTNEQYRDGVRDITMIREAFKQPYNLKDVMKFVVSENQNAKMRSSYTGEMANFIPTRNVYIPVNKEQVIANGTVRAADSAQIVDRVNITLTGNHLTKSELMVLDILATNEWKRPVYFGIGMGTDNYMGFEKYFQLEGAAYRVVPIQTAGNPSMLEYGRIDTEILYDNMMHKFDWGTIKDPKVNIDSYHAMTIDVMKYRNTFARLSQSLLAAGDSIRAIEVLDKSLEELPLFQAPFYTVDYIQLYYLAGQTEKANELASIQAEEAYQMLRYIHSLSPALQQKSEILFERRRSGMTIEHLVALASEYGQSELAQTIRNMIESIYNPTVVRPQNPELPLKLNTDDSQS